MKTAVITFGRMNPPTVGHEKLVNYMKKVANDKDASGVLVFLSHKQDNKENPLPYEYKYELCKKAFGDVVHKTKSRDIISAMKEIENMGYNNVIVVVGSDRVSEFDNLLNKYNKKEYNFNKIEVLSAGERDPDKSDVRGISASKMRMWAIDGKIEMFKKGLPSKLKISWKEIYKKIREVMLDNNKDNLNEALNYQQRLKRSRIMKREKEKIKRKRELALKRKASTSRLEKRARREAIKSLKDKYSGSRKYSDLSYQERQRIDDIVSRKTELIKRLTRQKMKEVRKREMKRLRETVDVDDLRDFLIACESFSYTEEDVLNEGNSKIDKFFKKMKINANKDKLYYATHWYVKYIDDGYKVCDDMSVKMSTCAKSNSSVLSIVSREHGISPRLLSEFIKNLIGQCILDKKYHP